MPAPPDGCGLPTLLSTVLHLKSGVGLLRGPTPQFAFLLVNFRNPTKGRRQQHAVQEFR